MRLQQERGAAPRGGLGKNTAKLERFAQKKEKSETSSRNSSRVLHRIGQKSSETRAFCPKGEEKQIHKVSPPLVSKIIMN